MYAEKKNLATRALNINLHYQEKKNCSFPSTVYVVGFGGYQYRT